MDRSICLKSVHIIFLLSTSICKDGPMPDSLYLYSLFQYIHVYKSGLSVAYTDASDNFFRLYTDKVTIDASFCIVYR